MSPVRPCVACGDSVTVLKELSGSPSPYDSLVLAGWEMWELAPRGALGEHRLPGVGHTCRRLGTHQYALLLEAPLRLAAP